MRKTFIMLTVVATLFMGSMTTSFAAAPKQPKNIQRSVNFVDRNRDGICDNYVSGKGKYFVDANGDGICDNQGKKVGCNSRKNKKK